MSTTKTALYRSPSFEEMQAIERQAHELRAAELARLLHVAAAWVRNLVHGGHHGTPVTH